MEQRGRIPTPVAYFRFHLDDRTVREVDASLNEVIRQHRSAGGCYGCIGSEHFVISFASYDAADQFARLLQGVWIERTPERPAGIYGYRPLQSPVEPRDLAAVLVVRILRRR